ncbi:hypothetical protein N9A94_06095 [Akkermansiaceae bacterium]|nr:hypothetical protein [Akkermansiaceae bacterium]MDB4537756.1 hypothetical protein [Akkermansiaceae bacterium]
MKKQFTATAVSLICIGSASAQSLFDLAPSNDDAEPLPLTWTAGAGLGYDDNAVPSATSAAGVDDESSMYGTAYVGASFLSRTPATTTEFFARLGIVHYFDDIDVGALNIDQSSATAGLGVNWTHRVSERLRFVSRNSLAYELEPDYSEGFQASRSNGNYLRWSTDNAVGYRWSERLGTYTGLRYEDISYDDIDGFDRSIISFYNDFRYQLSPQTVATFTYRLSEVDGGRVSDSTNNYFLAGLEHRFSPTAVGTIKVGVQNRDVDGGDDTSNPYVEASLKNQINEQFSIRAYGRYGVEDYSRGVAGNIYEGSETLRLGLTGTYGVSEQLSLNAGVNYASLGYVDQIVGAAGEIDEENLNLFVGFRLQVAETMWVDGKYNFETLTSDLGSNREYDRNRISLGINAQF